MLPRGEETSYIHRMTVIFKLLRVFLDKYLRLNSSPWWISLVYKRILFALNKSIMWIGQILIRKASFLQGLYLPCMCHDCHRVVSFFMCSNQIQCSLWAGSTLFLFQNQINSLFVLLLLITYKSDDIQHILWPPVDKFM